MITETQKTIFSQINGKQWNSLNYKILTLNENNMDGLRIHKGKKSFDIFHNENTDLYDCREVTIKEGLTFDINWIKGIFCENLQDLIRNHFYFN